MVPPNVLKTLSNGPFKAWQLDTPALLAKRQIEAANSAVVSQWIVQAPWAHAFWANYWLCMVHLRPIDRGEGPIETKLYLEGATHELWLYAISPEATFGAIFETGDVPFLTPINFAAQLVVPGGDPEARELLETAAADVLAMRLNPDTDWVRQWAARFGDNMMKGRAHG